VPLQTLDDLLGAERKQHTQHNDTNLSGKGTPTVERFG
jgi:hypothetical protein